jgi:hypothetical protein
VLVSPVLLGGIVVSPELRELLLKEHGEVNSWSRHVMDLFYKWFTAFVQVTVLAQAWLFAKEINTSALSAASKAVFICFIVSDLLGIVAATRLSAYIRDASSRLSAINKLLVTSEEISETKSSIPVGTARMGFISSRIGLACFALVWLVFLLQHAGIPHALFVLQLLPQ